MVVLRQGCSRAVARTVSQWPLQDAGEAWTKVVVVKTAGSVQLPKRFWR